MLKYNGGTEIDPWTYANTSTSRTGDNQWILSEKLADNGTLTNVCHNFSYLRVVANLFHMQ